MEGRIADKALSFVEKALPLINNEDQKAYYEKVVAGMKEAADMEDTDAKKARRDDAGVRYANQLAYFLFLQDSLTDELTAEVRALPSVDEVSAKYKEFEDAHKAHIEEINDMQRAVMAEQQSMDIFTAVILGNSREDAEAKMAEYERKVAEAQQA